MTTQNAQATSITLRKPDDFHIHFRDGQLLDLTVNHAAERFGRVGVMPNLIPPVITYAEGLEYRSRILNALRDGNTLDPLMIMFLQKTTSVECIKSAAQSPEFLGIKYYPSGVTTNSSSGVSNLKDVYTILEAMEKNGLPLLIHGESPAKNVDVFDREARFLEDQIEPVLKDFPGLKVVMEHISTSQAVDFVNAYEDRIGATITAHHLMYNRNDMLGDGIKPHMYCKPILKRATHQDALRKAATSGKACFFLGTDSAPHGKGQKECSSGCAGCYTSHAAIELYAEVFEQENALDKLEQFASLNGAAFYGIKPNEETITLVKESWTPEAQFTAGDVNIVPLRAGEEILWKIK
ncbi:MAG TPA: dihydroorotase [Gammaproteobacteria bacterium]|nr:dihydroorotase [Gammaproteobacteria bacterium]MEC8011187.1 dihydroorotase [Pseudomonadota bacterium]HBF08547.1 dihydroorotase [Gammaproteobacteria bacterium]HCK94019.1 dihydroorotase [Gammaproteobacteria bacterium]|tara:strand:- start:314 stop:1366 length:1053 start_codon:yes stop_codon:yes gene_type:complete